MAAFSVEQDDEYVYMCVGDDDSETVEHDDKYYEYYKYDDEEVVGMVVTEAPEVVQTSGDETAVEGSGSSVSATVEEDGNAIRYSSTSRPVFRSQSRMARSAAVSKNDLP